MDRKYKLPFVNGGKEFEIPPVTVGLYTKVLEACEKYENKSRAIYDNMKHIELAYALLKQVDPNVKKEDIMSMHPDDLAEFIIKAWMIRGKEKDNENFTQES